MKKIRIVLDYKFYSIWLYSENGDLIENRLPIELADDSQAGNLLENIQRTYDNLSIDDEINFEYIDFQNLVKTTFSRKY